MDAKQDYESAGELINNLILKRNSSTKTCLEVAINLSCVWGVSPSTAYNSIKQHLENDYYWGNLIYRTRTNSLGRSSKKLIPQINQRFCDYLTYLGYSQEESRQFISRLNNLCSLIEWKEPNEKLLSLKK